MVKRVPVLNLKRIEYAGYTIAECTVRGMGWKVWDHLAGRYLFDARHFDSELEARESVTLYLATEGRR